MATCIFKPYNNTHWLKIINLIKIWNLSSFNFIFFIMISFAAELKGVVVSEHDALRHDIGDLLANMQATPKR